MSTPVHPVWPLLSGAGHEERPTAVSGDLETIVDALRRPFAEALLGPVLPDDLRPGAQERALGKLVWTRQRETMAQIAECGALPMKGHASASTLYEVPWARCIGDLDVLILDADLPRLLRRLGDLGFAFGAPDSRRWGFQSAVSFLPMTSADGLVDIDLHIAPDEGPLGAGLTAAQVFSAANTLEDGLRVPCPTHAALIAISNLAKERFEPYVLRTLVDLVRLARGGGVDWDEVAITLNRVGLGPGWAVVATALSMIGHPALTPPGTSPAQLRMARHLANLDLFEIGGLQKAVREATICYAPLVLTSLWLRRVGGLFVRRTGIPG